jgi:Ca-activated chloride channel family protein
MKVLAFIILAAAAIIDPATVKKINSAKSAAEEAYKRGDYAMAIRHYQFIVDSLGVADDEVLLNMANAYYLSKDTTNAMVRYQAVSSSPKSAVKSKALQQLGVMANQQGRSEEALKLFKEAIKASPTNDDARYNYEMLKKKLEEQKKQEEEKQQQNKDQQKKDQQQQDQQKQEQQNNKDQQEKDQQDEESEQQQNEKPQDEQEKKEQQEKEQQQKDQQDQQESKREDMPNLDRDKLNEMKMSEEKARMILEAMRNQEKQYLQQQKRKPTQSKDRNKPDW